MKDQLEKMILKKVEKYAKELLAEIDLEELIRYSTSGREVNDIVKKLVKIAVSKALEKNLYAKLEKHKPIIDAWTVNKVDGFLIELGIKV